MSEPFSPIGQIMKQIFFVIIKESVLGFENNPFARFVNFAVHRIRPSATFSPSDAEKELFWRTIPQRSSPSSCNAGLNDVINLGYFLGV
jgi:hypothetical protein